MRRRTFTCTRSTCDRNAQLVSTEEETPVCKPSYSWEPMNMGNPTFVRRPVFKGCGDKLAETVNISGSGDTPMMERYSDRSLVSLAIHARRLGMEV